MQLIESNVQRTGHSSFQAGLREPVECRRYPDERERKAELAVPHRVLALVALSLAAVTGPPILDAVVHASLALIQTLLEICQMGLVAYQIFGR
jgi:hypothetical protein